MSNDSKKKYNTISTELRNDIKKRFEFGEHLIDLCLEYKVNFNTMKNYASKKSWKKGKTIDIVYAKEMMAETDEVVKKRADIKKLLDNLGMSLLSYMFELEKNKQRPTNKNIEEALKHRLTSATLIKDYMKDIHNFRSPEEQLKLEEMVINIEKLKATLDDEETDVDLD